MGKGKRKRKRKKGMDININSTCLGLSTTALIAGNLLPTTMFVLRLVLRRIPLGGSGIFPFSLKRLCRQDRGVLPQLHDSGLGRLGDVLN